MMFRSLCLTIVLLALAACSSDRAETPRMCPQTAIIRELERLHDYGDDLPGAGTWVASATMQGVTGRCDYGDDGVDVSFDLAIKAEKGDRLGGDTVNLPFFVSVLTPDGTILGKDRMTSTVEFARGEKTADATERLRVFIPLDGHADGSNYRILMGFQLTSHQLETVRKQEDDRNARLKGQP